jgi:hypothetical protein
MNNSVLFAATQQTLIIYSVGDRLQWSERGLHMCTTNGWRSIAAGEGCIINIPLARSCTTLHVLVASLTRVLHVLIICGFSFWWLSLSVLNLIFSSSGQTQITS